MLKTTCDLTKVIKEEQTNGGLKFWVTCENVTFFPLGVEIDCLDKNRETSCFIKTKIQEFKEVDLLQRSVKQRHDLSRRNENKQHD